MKELVDIQSRLKAPKGQYNRFGQYRYRSAEDILESVKPLLGENGCTLTVTDDIIQIGARIYVKATATIRNGNGEMEQTTAFAREEESKKGMDGSQVTGAASSYARKYALNGLFCIDDTKDADATNTHGKDEAATAAKPAAKPAAKQTTQQPVTASAQFAPSDADAAERLALALQEVGAAQSRKTLTDIWNAYRDLQGTPRFAEAVKEASAKFPK